MVFSFHVGDTSVTAQRRKYWGAKTWAGKGKGAGGNGPSRRESPRVATPNFVFEFRSEYALLFVLDTKICSCHGL